MTGGGTLELRAAGKPFDLGTINFTAGTGTIDYSVSATGQTITATNYYNLAISGSRDSNNVLLESGNIVISGYLDLSANFDPMFGVVPQAGNTVVYDGSFNQLIAPIAYEELLLTGPGTKVITTGLVAVQNALNLVGAGVTISTNANLHVNSFTGDAASSIFIDMTSALTISGAVSSGYDGAFTGDGSILMFGLSGLFLNGNGAGFTGIVDINSGFVVLGNGAALGSSGVVTVHTGGALITETPNPIPISITLDNGRLGAAGVGARSFAGSILVTSNSNIGLFDDANPSQPLGLELSGSLTLSGGDLTVFGPPPPMQNPPPSPVLKISGAVFGGPLNVGPSSEVEIATTGTFNSSIINVGTGGILTAKNTTANQSVTVHLDMGAVLRGTGEFSDFCMINSMGGIIQPGPITGAGTLPLTTGGGSPSTLSLDSTTVLEFDLGSPTTSDKITVSGPLVLDGSLVLKPAAGFGLGTYTLFTHGGLTNNTLNLPPAPPGLSFALDTTTASNEVRLVVSAQSLAFTNPSSATVEVGSSFTLPIIVSGPSSPPVTVSNTALPPGLRRNGLQIEGNPTSAGTFTVTLTASNGLTSATQTLTITVNQPVVSSTFGPFVVEGKVGTPFFFDFTEQVTQTISSVTVNVALPSGLTKAGTVISGTPKVAGSTTLTATLTFANGSGTATIQVTILEKTETLGPVLSDLLIDPEQPGINEVILMSVIATHPQNLPVTVTWNFGDGTTGSGDFVEKTYTAGNTYTITVTATAGDKTTTLTKALVVSDIDPNAPVITSAGASPTPSLVGQVVTFTASTTDANGDTVTLNWDFGDGSSTDTGSPVTFTYGTAGEYSVSVIATDSTGKTSRTNRFTHYVSQAASMQTAPIPVGTGAAGTVLPGGSVVLGLDSVDLFEGTGDAVDAPGAGAGEDGGGEEEKKRKKGAIARLKVMDGGKAFSRADMEVDTDFGIQGRRAVKGSSPSAEFDKPMLAVAKSTARELGTRKEKGKARKTIPISARDVAKTPVVDKEPTDTKMNGLKLKGDFFPSRSAGSSDSLSRDGAGSRATKPDVLNSDKVTATGAIMMPGGLDMSEGTEVQVALGNIVDKVVIDAKGKGKGKFTTLQMRIKTDKTTKKSVADVAAKFTIKMSVAEMVDNGFDTEGVVVSKAQAGAELEIQCAMMIGEVTYAINGPVTLKVSPKEDKASMSTRRAN